MMNIFNMNVHLMSKSETTSASNWNLIMDGEVHVHFYLVTFNFWHIKSLRLNRNKMEITFRNFIY